MKKIQKNKWINMNEVFTGNNENAGKSSAMTKPQGVNTSKSVTPSFKRIGDLEISSEDSASLRQAKMSYSETSPKKEAILPKLQFPKIDMPKIDVDIQSITGSTRQLFKGLSKQLDVATVPFKRKTPSFKERVKNLEQSVGYRWRVIEPSRKNHMRKLDLITEESAGLDDIFPETVTTLFKEEDTDILALAPKAVNTEYVYKSPSYRFDFSKMPEMQSKVETLNEESRNRARRQHQDVSKTIDNQFIKHNNEQVRYATTPIYKEDSSSVNTLAESNRFISNRIDELVNQYFLSSDK